MAETTQERLAKTPPLERAPLLRVVPVRAKNIGEAVDKSVGGAGWAELKWVLENQKKSQRMLGGNGYSIYKKYFFFPNVTAGDRVACLEWTDGSWVMVYGCHRTDKWLWNDRVVKVG